MLSLCYFSHFTGGEKKKKRLESEESFNDFSFSRLGKEPRADSNFHRIWPEALPILLVLPVIFINKHLGFFFQLYKHHVLFIMLCTGYSIQSVLFMQSIPSTAVCQKIAKYGSSLGC